MRTRRVLICELRSKHMQLITSEDKWQQWWQLVSIREELYHVSRLPFMDFVCALRTSKKSEEGFEWKSSITLRVALNSLFGTGMDPRWPQMLWIKQQTPFESNRQWVVWSFPVVYYLMFTWLRSVQVINSCTISNLCILSVFVVWILLDWLVQPVA